MRRRSFFGGVIASVLSFFGLGKAEATPSQSTAPEGRFLMLLSGSIMCTPQNAGDQPPAFYWGSEGWLDTKSTASKDSRVWCHMIPTNLEPGVYARSLSMAKLCPQGLVVVGTVDEIMAYFREKMIHSINANMQGDVHQRLHEQSQEYFDRHGLTQLTEFTAVYDEHPAMEAIRKHNSELLDIASSEAAHG